MVEDMEGAIVPAAGTAGAPPNAFAAGAVAAARAYAAEALAPATLRAYAADWRHFCGWCAEAGCAPLPAPPTAVAAYLASLAGLYSRAALDRRLAAIGQQHRLRGLAWAVGDPAIRTTLQGIAMILGRYAIIVPMLTVAGSLALKSPVPATAGTFPTHGPLFVLLLVITVLILGALTFFPALVLGPIAEHVSMLGGQTF